MADKLSLESNSIRIEAGAIVILARFPGEKWILNNGTYTYNGQAFHGWYFKNVVSRSIIPVTEAELENIKVIARHYKESDIIMNCPCKPTPSPTPTPTPEYVSDVELYQIGTAYYAGQIIYLKTGELYQASKNFKSSAALGTVEANFAADIDNGNLVATAITGDLTSVETVKVEIPFRQYFGTNQINTQLANMYLLTLDPPRMPTLSTYFKNIDVQAPNFGFIYSYYNTPSGALEIQQDTVDTGASGFHPTSSQLETINSGISEQWVDEIDDFRNTAYSPTNKPTPAEIGAISHETDPTVPLWAKSPNKPTYTADEVGAVAVEVDPMYLADKPGIALKSDIPDLTPYAKQTDMTQAQSDISTAQADISTLQTDMTTVKGNITNIKTDIGTINTALEAVGQTDLLLESQISNNDVTQLNYDITNRTLAVHKNGGADVTTILAQADATHDGLMTSADVSTLSSLVNDVDSIKAGGVYRAMFDTYAELVAAYPGLDVSATNWSSNDFVFVVHDEDYDATGKTETSFAVVVDGATKTLLRRKVERVEGEAGGEVVVPIATNTSLGSVKGDNTNTVGKIYVETDGSQSVIGWDAHMVQITEKATKVVSAVAGNLAGLNSAGDLTDSGGKLSDLATKVNLSDAIATVNVDISSLKTDMTTAKSDIATNKTDIASTNAVVSGLSISVGSLASDVTDLNATVVALENDVSTISESITTIEAEIDTKIDKVTSAVSGNIPLFDNTGSLIDSGKTPDDFSGGNDLVEGTDYVGINPNHNGKAKAERISAPIVSIGNTTLRVSDAGCLVQSISTNANTITIPTNASVPIPVESEIEIVRMGSGAVTIAATSGVTIRCSETARTIAKQYQSVCLKKIGTDEWLLQGNLG